MLCDVRVSLFVCVCSWMAENTPYYYSRAVEAVGPLLEDGQEKIKIAVVFITQKSSELVEWLRENVPLLMEWVRIALN